MSNLRETERKRQTERNMSPFFNPRLRIKIKPELIKPRDISETLRNLQINIFTDLVNFIYD